MVEVEAAGRHPEGGHQEARAVGGETGAAHRFFAPGDDGGRMQVARDLAGLRAGPRFVAEGEAAMAEAVGGDAGQAEGAVGIVVAGNPDPFPPARHVRDHLAKGRRHQGGADAVVEGVAEADDDLRIMPDDQPRDERQGRQRVVGRKHHATPGKGGALLQMQVGDDEHVERGQQQPAHRIEHGANAGHLGFHQGARQFRLRPARERHLFIVMPYRSCLSRGSRRAPPRSGLRPLPPAPHPAPRRPPAPCRFPA